MFIFGVMTLPKSLYYLIKKKVIKKKYGWFGNYASWEEASSFSSGYDNDLILAKTKEASLRVLNGEFAYERDSCLFDQIQYSWPVIAGLLRAASENGNKLSVLDFGGSLGSSYYQNRSFLSCLNLLNWSIIEQRTYVQYGKELFEDGILKFYNTIEEALSFENPNVLLLSGVIQYLQNPLDVLLTLIDQQIPYIVIDRTAFWLDIKRGKPGYHRLTVQVVPETIYKASYPAWFFEKDRFLQLFTGKYDLIADFDANDPTVDLSNGVGYFKGFLFKLTKNCDPGSNRSSSEI